MAQYTTNWGPRPRQSGALSSWPERLLFWVHLRWRRLLVLVLCVGLAAGGVAWWRNAAEDRETAAAGQLYRASQATEKVDEALQGVMASFPKTTAAQLARFKLAALALEKQEWQRAVELLKPVADGGPVAGGMQPLAIERLASAYEEGKDYASAAAYFQRLIQMKGNATVDRAGALRGAVRCFMAAQQVEAARTLLETTVIEGEGSATRDTDRLWFEQLAQQP